MGSRRAPISRRWRRPSEPGRCTRTRSGPSCTSRPSREKPRDRGKYARPGERRPVESRSMASHATRPAETDLYHAVRSFLEEPGYAVKSEIRACDVDALRGDQRPVSVHLKLTSTLAPRV